LFVRRGRASAALSQWKTGGMAFVDVGPMRMYYDRRGPREAETLVLLHGGGGDANDAVGGWAGLADRFAEHFDVVLPDHRGHGRTANPEGWMSFTQMGDDLNALLEHLDAGPAHLAGISDGGVMVLDQAMRRPETVRTGVIIGANYCVDERTLGAAEGIDPESIERDHPDVAASFAARHDRGKYPGFWKNLIGQIIENNRTNPAWSLDDLRSIGCPMLLIAGEDDPFANADQMTTMKSQIPGAEWLIVNHAGHAVHAEHPDFVGSRIIDFLRRHHGGVPQA
jgi:pimeloyl-ACP methyl ester carboxylesterase